MPPVEHEAFDGNDFSNNLFTDLAPLLTLFGELVTQQFLSMSMGWADSILLAMGPLGIITIIVSAIRVGGGKGLKALIGRARESRSVVEQEVLSSTSESVCELWSGEQVVRMIGASKKVKALVISQDGKIFTLNEATQLNYTRYVGDRRGMNIIDGFRDTIPNSGLHTVQDLNNPEDRAFMEMFESLSTVAPNVALNATGAIASPEARWFWAVIGVVFQTFTIAFPGVMTYYRRWDIFDSHNLGYGYPCYCAGTVCLLAGIALCGYIIDMVTTEHEFSLRKRGLKRRMKFFVLQEHQTVGDQTFPSTIVRLAEHSNVLRISRLNRTNYRDLTTISAGLVIAGYIIQFVGLRALHWLAAIMQLGVTLIMTAIRAWVRKSLASRPKTQPPMFGVEAAWLALYIVSDNPIDNNVESDEMKSAATNRQSIWSLRAFSLGCLKGVRGLSKRLRSLLIGEPAEIASDLIGHIHETQVFWELISGQSTDTMDDASSSWQTQSSAVMKKKASIYKVLFSPVNGPLTVALDLSSGETRQIADDGRQSADKENTDNEGTGEDRQSTDADSQYTSCTDTESQNTSGSNNRANQGYQTYPKVPNPIRAFKNLAKTPDIAQKFTDNNIVHISKTLCSLIEKTMEIFAAEDGIIWKPTSGGSQLKSEEGFHEVNWAFCGSQSQVGAHQQKQTPTPLKFRMIRETQSSNEPGSVEPRRWRLLNPELVLAVISLSVYTDAVRCGLYLHHIPTTRHFRRIVGYATREDSEVTKRTLRIWLDHEILEAGPVPATLGSDCNNGRRDSPYLYLGMFVSSLSHPSSPCTPAEPFVELCIPRMWTPDKKWDYAQELYSIFLLAIASAIEKIEGETEEIEYSDSGYRLHNSIFDKIIQAVMEKGFVDGVDYAKCLVIPAFAKYNLLPVWPNR